MLGKGMVLLACLPCPGELQGAHGRSFPATTLWKVEV